MPVVIETPSSRPSDRPASGDAVEIALLNNMSDAGLERGERQFIDRLDAAAGSRLVRLRLYSLPEIVRGPVGRRRIERAYMPFERLYERPLDGLIVTGCEPREASLRDEPFWPRLAEVIDWAGRHTRSTIWSCLAAHAAALHLDGIERRPAPRKISGVFDVARAAPHPLFAGAGDALRVPHSRWNDLAERDLVAAGYQILTRSDAIGVDAAVRPGRSLFLFLQGHPEYDADALLREYRRDVQRFLAGASDVYPSVPVGYLSPDMEAPLAAFEARARDARRPDLFARFPLGAHGPAPVADGDAVAATLFGNWLGALQAEAAEHAA